MPGLWPRTLVRTLLMCVACSGITQPAWSQWWRGRASTEPITYGIRFLGVDGHGPVQAPVTRMRVGERHLVKVALFAIRDGQLDASRQLARGPRGSVSVRCESSDPATVAIEPAESPVVAHYDSAFAQFWLHGLRPGKVRITAHAGLGGDAAATTWFGPVHVAPEAVASPKRLSAPPQPRPQPEAAQVRRPHEEPRAEHSEEAKPRQAANEETPPPPASVTTNPTAVAAGVDVRPVIPATLQSPIGPAAVPAPDTSGTARPAPIDTAPAAPRRGDAAPAPPTPSGASPEPATSAAPTAAVALPPVAPALSRNEGLGPPEAPPARGPAGQNTAAAPVATPGAMPPTAPTATAGLFDDPAASAAMEPEGSGPETPVSSSPLRPEESPALPPARSESPSPSGVDVQPPADRQLAGGDLAPAPARSGTAPVPATPRAADATSGPETPGLPPPANEPPPCPRFTELAIRNLADTPMRVRVRDEATAHVDRLAPGAVLRLHPARGGTVWVQVHRPDGARETVRLVAGVTKPGARVIVPAFAPQPWIEVMPTLADCAADPAP